MRAFPIQAPDEGISLMTGDGREAAWIPSLAALAPVLRSLIEEELHGREFMLRRHRDIDQVEVKAEARPKEAPAGDAPA